ncbi:MAG: sensor histidine kinase [Actinomycetota bacterium]
MHRHGRRSAHRHGHRHDDLLRADGDEIVFPVWAPAGAALMAVVVAVGVAAQRGAISSPGWATVLVALAALPWVLDIALFLKTGRGVPLPLFVLVVLGAVFALVVDPVDIDFAPFFLVLLVGEMAARLDPANGALVLAASMAVMIGVEVLGRYDGSFIWVVGLALGWAGGFGCRVELQLLQEMKASQATLAEKAATEERQRIAREIHDVIAHTLSVTMLHLTGARLALERGDRDDAVAALRDAEEMGRESLGDIRRTVGVLGADGSGTDAPMPTATELPDLVAGFQAAGLDVALDVQGDPAGLPPALGLSVYRITQESLANVAKHAPVSHTEVRLAVDPDCVHLVVADHDGRTVPVPSENGGLGLRGMRERAAALGGSLDARPDGDGWLVEATLPRPGARRRNRC